MELEPVPNAGQSAERDGPGRGGGAFEGIGGQQETEYNHRGGIAYERRVRTIKNLLRCVPSCRRRILDDTHVLGSAAIVLLLAPLSSDIQSDAFRQEGAAKQSCLERFPSTAVTGSDGLSAVCTGPYL